MPTLTPHRPRLLSPLSQRKLSGDGRKIMKESRRSFLKKSAATAAALSVSPRAAVTQPSAIRIGVIYDLTGPFAAGGSIACSIGAQIAIDLVNEKGGVAGKYKVEPVNADSQSKADVAINEVETLPRHDKLPNIHHAA